MIDNLYGVCVWCEWSKTTTQNTPPYNHFVRFHFQFTTTHTMIIRRFTRRNQFYILRRQCVSSSTKEHVYDGGRYLICMKNRQYLRACSRNARFLRGAQIARYWRHRDAFIRIFWNIYVRQNIELVWCRCILVRVKRREKLWRKFEPRAFEIRNFK